MKDKCIICGQPTEYDYTTPIEMRRNYIDGCGQICTNCAEGSKPLFKPKKDKPFLKLFLSLFFDISCLDDS